jgi:ribosome-associated translation inhibitor RaiA
MRIAICGLNFSLTEAIKDHIHRCLEMAMGPAREGAGDVVVRVWDINGERGGADKACRIALYSWTLGNACVEAVDRDLYRAVQKASAKLRERLRRHRGKQRTMERAHASRRQALA